MTQPVDPGAAEPIRSADRSGVLRPQNLARFAAGRLAPDSSVADLVDQYWHVQWRLDRDESITQRIIDMPAVTLTIEEGNVPAPFVITGVQSGAWVRRIEDRGSVFAIRLRPAGLGVLSNLHPSDLADSATPLTPQLDLRLHGLLSEIATERTSEARVRAADAAIRRRHSGKLSALQALANAVYDLLTGDVRATVGPDLAVQLGVSERSIQRALKATIGHGPKWISRRIRLQEVACLLATEADVDLAELALRLGYTDQAHLTNDFRAIAEVSPDAYRRSLAAQA